MSNTAGQSAVDPGIGQAQLVAEVQQARAWFGWARPLPGAGG
jgi:hypothetical protein